MVEEGDWEWLLILDNGGNAKVNNESRWSSDKISSL